MVDRIDVEEVAVRSGTTAAWAAAGAPVLARGELGIDLDASEVRIGDGASAFTDLPVTAGGGGSSLIGPVRVTMDTPGFLSDPGAELGITLDAGTIIERAWLEAADAFVGTVSGDFVAINVCTPADPAGTYTSPVYYDLSSGGEGANPMILQSVVSGADAHIRTPVRLVQQLQVRVAGFFSTPEGITGGIVNLFLITRTGPVPA